MSQATGRSTADLKGAVARLASRAADWTRGGSIWWSAAGRASGRAFKGMAALRVEYEPGEDAACEELGPAARGGETAALNDMRNVDYDPDGTAPGVHSCASPAASILPASRSAVRLGVAPR